MAPIVSIKSLSKTYEGGHKALKNVSFDIEEGEILALLGPNGAGKTTLISIICGLVTATSGSVSVAGYDVVENFRKSRELIGLVPQEITLEPFTRVFSSVSFSRGLFGKSPKPELVETLLRRLTLWEKKDSAQRHLSGGMKRRVLIAKALSHEPRILFLDEPTAGVDVELRKDMWNIVEDLKAQGVTVILTTHYIEEAEAIADRVGVINNGELLLVEDKNTLMQRLGRKEMVIELQSPLKTLPQKLTGYNLSLSEDGCSLVFTYDTQKGRTGIARLLSDFHDESIAIRDLQPHTSSLEEIFVDLVKGEP